MISCEDVQVSPHQPVTVSAWLEAERAVQLGGARPAQKDGDRTSEQEGTAWGRDKRGMKQDRAGGTAWLPG